MALSFSLICPQALIAEGQAKMVTAPGVEGEFGIFAHHEAFASLLRAGLMIIEDDMGQKDYFFIRSGFLTCDGEEIMILADEAHPLNQLDEQSLHQKISDGEDDCAHIQDEARLGEIKRDLRLWQAQLDALKRARQ